MNIRSSLIVVGLICGAAATRLMPHPANFAPVMGIALFGSAVFSNRWGGIGIAIAAMVVSDAVIGFHSTLPFVYVGMLITGILGFYLRQSRPPARILGFALTGSLIFFIVSNLGVFLLQDLYPKSFTGLVSCYTMAIPFLQNSVAGDLLYTSALFLLHHIFVVLPQENSFAPA